MPTSVTARATAGPSEPFTQVTIERRDLGPHDVKIKVHYAGICHSDIHTGRDEWAGTHFPLVPGHEVAGTVEEVGEAVTKVKVGDRVGVGVMVDSCGECGACTDGQEQFCERGMVEQYNSRGYDGHWHDGGYSTHTVVKDHFVCHIPEGIGLDVAAPLMCAGITTYSPLKRWGAGPGKRVGVVGLGGLGHMAVKLAVAMGAEVAVLSRTAAKADDAAALGAQHFLNTSEAGALKAHRASFDLIINTVSAPLDMSGLLDLLRRGGAVVNVGAPPADTTIPIHPFSLIQGDKVWAGSMIGGIARTQEMLDFCAEHGIGADIELISADEIDTAWDRVVDSDVRYRFVIDAATI
ncbi:NAD(P)-dependent alcohol dehydrogenase [Conexibacter sp. DBS9H8]|uniref:NAD(P)-dependent alcohol dehydrogenase n=1 Tax=Conexibacter sp. DBS9H8 TaxID=2937801 RepID=UPI00200FC556|nr:NAD(P)-dependent alcohol dehydrogenase [Conexibacter sp. DBS9H8]